MIKAVIFDADGPLYNRDTRISGLKKELLMSFGFKGNYADFESEYEKEKLAAYVNERPLEQTFQKILAAIGLQLEPQQLADFIQNFNEIHKKISATEHAGSTLRKLKEMQLKICILTDSFYGEEEKWNWFRSINLDKSIDCIVTSFDIRKLKDTKEAYEECLKKLQMKSEETIFVGHKQYEMDGAKRASVLSVALIPISEVDIKSRSFS